MSLLLTHSQRSVIVRNGLAGYYDFEKRNLIRFSQQLDDPAWGASQATITADVPSPLAPNGSASADKMEGSGTDGSVSQTGIGILASTALYVLGVVARGCRPANRVEHRRWVRRERDDFGQRVCDPMDTVFHNLHDGRLGEFAERLHWRGRVCANGRGGLRLGRAVERGLERTVVRTNNRQPVGTGPERNGATMDSLARA